jgi:release factor glutamine methyltransferase
MPATSNGDAAYATWGTALGYGSELLAATSPTADLDAAVLLSHITGSTRAQLSAYPERELTLAQRQEYRSLLSRRAIGEPVAYLTGHREFMGLDLLVDARALVPRPETELVVEAALDEVRARLRQGTVPSVVDIGTGTGAIAIALAVLEPRLPGVFAVDLSRGALALAEQNAERIGVRDRILLLEGDLLQPLRALVDVVAANLPYIAPSAAAALPRDVRQFEPSLALFGDDDGLGHFRRLFAMAPEHLATGATLILEIGYDQGVAVADLARAALPTARIAVRQDYAGLDRLVTVATGDKLPPA